MIVPQFWAEARAQQHDGQQLTVQRFGWSDLSQDDAQRNADVRAEEALRRLLAGEKLIRREPKVPYNGAVGVPIREEILARHGNVVVTRNAYGAHCLNCPDVLFVDIDYPNSAPWPLHAVLGLAWLVLSILAWRQFSGLPLFGVLAGIGIVYTLLTNLVNLACRRTASTTARKRVRRFSAQHPDWGLRLYATPGGLRVLATHALFRPDAPETAACFAALGADPVYVHMCRNQQCFRARLSGKPWRMGIATHMRPRPGVWPVRAEHRARREEWTQHYDQVATNHAACRYLETLGSPRIAFDIAPVVELHDSACRARTTLPLA